MSRSLRDHLALGAEAVKRPTLDVADLVAQAEGRLRRRRLVAVAAGAAVVAGIIAGGWALGPDDREPAPAPPPPRPSPSETSKPETSEPEPPPGPAMYFDALAVDGDDLTDPARLFSPKDLWVTRKGETPRQVLATGADEHCPRVSPDGRMLAHMDGRRTIVVRRLDATGDVRATVAEVGYDVEQLSCPQWSPDGRRVAVAVADYEAPDQVAEVRVVELDGTNRLVATQRAQHMPLPEIAWSPTGDAIAFTTPGSVWIAPLDGGEPRTAWPSSPPQAPLGPLAPGTVKRLAWLPTGELAVSALVQYTSVGQDETLHIVDPRSGRDQVVGTFNVDLLTWSWSPDGARLVFADSDGGARVLDRTTGRSVPVRPRLGGKEIPIWKLTWSADGHRLVGTAADADPSTTAFALVSMRPDGSSLEVLTPWTLALYSEAEVSWSPQ